MGQFLLRRRFGFRLGKENAIKLYLYVNIKTNIMKINSITALSVLSLILIALSSCSLVEGIFKAGVWVGILFVAGIIGLVIFLISKMGGK